MTKRKNLAFLLQKKGGTLEEFIDFAAEQVLPFEPEDEQKINDTLDWMQKQLESHGLELPDPGEITFVKTTSKEAASAGGYTSEGAVFLTADFLPIFRKSLFGRLFCMRFPIAEGIVEYLKKQGDK